MPLSHGVGSEIDIAFNTLCAFNILVLLEDSNRRVFAVDGVLGDDDFLDLLLRGQRRTSHRAWLLENRP